MGFSSRDMAVPTILPSYQHESMSNNYTPSRNPGISREVYKCHLYVKIPFCEICWGLPVLMACDLTVVIGRILWNKLMVYTAQGRLGSLEGKKGRLLWVFQEFPANLFHIYTFFLLYVITPVHPRWTCGTYWWHRSKKFQWQKCRSLWWHMPLWHYANIAPCHLSCPWRVCHLAVTPYTYRHQHPCVYEHGTTIYPLAKDDIVKRFDGKGMAVVGFEVDQVRRTDHGNLDHGWLLGTLVWLDRKQCVLWVGDDKMYTCIHYESYAVIHIMMCLFAYESLLVVIVYNLYMYCVLSISILFPNIYQRSAYFMVIDACMPDPCFLGDLDRLKKNMWIVKCTEWNMEVEHDPIVKEAHVRDILFFYWRTMIG